LKTAIAGIALALASALCARAEQAPQHSSVTIDLRAQRVNYFSDSATIQARGDVVAALSNGVTVRGDACSIDLSLRRIVVAGHVRLNAPGASYGGAAFADFLAFRRAYFVPLSPTPDRWTFLNDDYGHPEKGREMPGDAFFLTDLGDARPFIVAKEAVIDPENYVRFDAASFVFLNGGIQTPALPRYVRNFSHNQNFGVNSLAGATYDIPYGIAGSSTSLDTAHFRYDQQRKTYFSFEHHSVFGQAGYAVFSVNPITQPAKQWSWLTYLPTGTSSALVFDAQLFTYQYGLIQPLSSNGFADLRLTRALRNSSVTAEVSQAYGNLLAPNDLGYYGDPSHSYTQNHPTTEGVAWSGYDQRAGRSGLTFRLLSGAGHTRDVFGVGGSAKRDVESLYVGAIVSTPVYRAPWGTGLNGIYQGQHVWLSYPNSMDFQTVTVSESKRFSSKFALTASWVFQSVITRRVDETLASPNSSTGLVPQPASPNGLPLLAGTLTAFPHVSNQALVLTAAVAPSPAFQFTVSAQRNNYRPIQQPFVAGPPRYQAAADIRTRLGKTLFVDIGRAYYFDWAGQRWSPAFSIQVSEQ